MHHSRQSSAHILIVSFCCLLMGCSGDDGGGGKSAKATGGGETSGDSVSVADVNKVKTGMSVQEVEAILGNGEEATAPKGKGLPLGMYTTVDGESKFLNNTYRKWRIGEETFVIAFFDGHVSGMFDGSPAVVSSTQPEERPASEDPAKLVEKGGAFWSSPRTFLQKEVTLTGGERFWIWPKGDVTKQETTFELDLNWRLRPGQPQPASEGEESFLAFTPFLDNQGVSVWPAQRIKLQAAAEGQLKIHFNIEEVGADGYVLCYLSKELPGKSLEEPSKTLLSNLLRLKVQDK